MLVMPCACLEHMWTSPAIHPHTAGLQELVPRSCWDARSAVHGNVISATAFDRASQLQLVCCTFGLGAVSMVRSSSSVSNACTMQHRSNTTTSLLACVALCTFPVAKSERGALLCYLCDPVDAVRLSGWG